MWSSNGEIIGVGLNFGIGFNYSYDWYVFLVDSENGNLLSDIKKLQLVKGYDNEISGTITESELRPIMIFWIFHQIVKELLIVY